MIQERVVNKKKSFYLPRSLRRIYYRCSSVISEPETNFHGASSPSPTLLRLVGHSSSTQGRPHRETYHAYAAQESYMAATSPILQLLQRLNVDRYYFSLARPLTRTNLENVT